MSSYYLSIHLPIFLLFGFFIYMFFFLKRNILELKKQVHEISELSNKFRESSFLEDRILTDSIQKLNTFAQFPEYLRSACIQGIINGTKFLKHVYIREKYDNDLMYDMIRNIFTSIRLSDHKKPKIKKNLTDTQLIIEEKQKEFADFLEHELSLIIPNILKEINAFKAGNYNGHSFEEFRKMAGVVIEMILKTIDSTYYRLL